jgi:ComF family protein
MSDLPASERPFVRYGAALRSLARRGLDLLLPAQCLACRALVGEPGRLCSKCFAEAHLLAEPLCRVCGLPLPGASAISGRPELDMACGRCLAEPPSYRRARAVFAFGDVAKRLVHDFKYHDRLEGQASFGEWLARAGAQILESADLLVPVPLHYGRLIRRRYNQAAALAAAVSKVAGVPAAPLVLKRVRATASQTGLSAEERARNVRGAFAVRSRHLGAIKDAHIALVDDVLTTGATAEACSKVLLKAGAREVSVLTLARVGEP